MTVFSCATVLWGLLSNTWFGTQIPWCADWPTVVWLADPSYGNMMLLCFTIGASHLMLARIWNGICRLNSLECLVEFGWAGVLLFMYFVVNSIVGIMTGVPTWAFWVFGVSVLMIVSKTRGIELGMLPLNIMGSMGDIISYVRLFAVGYASLQVAQNFNEMALAFDLPLWAKAIPAVLILLFGHLLNLMLAGLAVLVHAVRLNTLEFSTHKGLTWSGRRFNPFKKNR
jgi:V/A-type H+-transporting ATPase subunit I